MLRLYAITRKTSRSPCAFGMGFCILIRALLCALQPVTYRLEWQQSDGLRH
jgi:hypothetical protein